MAIKTYKPTTPSRRHMTVSAFEGIDKKAKPERKLTEVLKKNAGRNSYGRITVRHHGGGNKQKYRIIDFKRDKMDVCPPPSCAWSTIRTAAPTSLSSSTRTASAAMSSLPSASTPVTRSFPPPGGHQAGQLPAAANIPVGTVIHNIELHPGKGAQLVRSAGVCRAADGEGERRRSDPYALRRGAQRPHQLHRLHRPGRQLDHGTFSIGKAGRKRHMGSRPTVRGSVMNPCDHPHGGGEGKAPSAVPARSPRGASRRWVTRPARRTRPTSSSSSAATRSKEASEMSRSIKKGPFVAPELIKRVEEMNKTGEKKVLKTWSRLHDLPLLSSATPSPSMTAASTFPSMCRGHGWSQAGRVRSHPYLPRPCRQQDLQLVSKEETEHGS